MSSSVSGQQGCLGAFRQMAHFQQIKGEQNVVHHLIVDAVRKWQHCSEHLEENQEI